MLLVNVGLSVSVVMASRLGLSNSIRLSGSKLLGFSKCRFSATANHTNVQDSDQSDFVKKLIYSSKANENKKRKRLLAMKAAIKERKAGAVAIQKQSIALKLYTGFVEVERTPELTEKLDEPPDVVLPMSLKVAPVCYDVSAAEKETSQDQSHSDDLQQDSSTKSVRKFWSNDYVKLMHLNTPAEVEETTDNDWSLMYGSSNPEIPSSHVPCGGCGALLHCKAASIPGFIPQELFTQWKSSELRSVTCQRCYFLQNHNTALSVAVDQEIYPKIIQNIKRKGALVLLAIDLTDFPCSIWPGITDLIGLECPLFLVGNKMDLLWGDSKGWMAHVENAMRSCFPAKANIIGTQLISAKTGFGVEDLITKLQQTWSSRGDVYLVGCTNVGKSTLFNALLQSDYCKVKAADLLQRATTAPWPGTTLNLLKFPIMRPEGWRVYLRSKRLKSDANRFAYSRMRRLQEARNNPYTPPQLIGHIGRTFHNPIMPHEDPFAAPDFNSKKEPIPGSGLNPKDPDFVRGRWFYDTPGVLHHDQILDLLTTEELVKVLPQDILEPRVIVMKPDWTLFLGGLARIDFVEGTSDSTKWVVFASKDIPITICFTSSAQETYDNLLGSEYFAFPTGEPERLKKWPSLESNGELKFSGLSRMECCGDVVLSSCGWVSFAPDSREVITIRAWTPQARGIYTRPTALLPNAVNLRGRLKQGTPEFHRSPPLQRRKVNRPK